MNKPKTVMVDMSATLIHHGHVRLIARAAEYGRVIIGLTSDEEVRKHKGYTPELSFSERKEILEAIAGVDGVVETPWHITEAVLDGCGADYLVHAGENFNAVRPERVIQLPRTEGVSSTDLRYRAQRSLADVNNRKLMLTPGPATVLHENLTGLKPVFGRGDPEFEEMRNAVITWIRELSGQDEVIYAQGSATFAIELAANTFVSGTCLLVSSGYYSDRIANLLPADCRKEVIPYATIGEVEGRFDWVAATYTETANGFRSDINGLRTLADRVGARLLLDATGSIGLEPGHDLADVAAFSSCKGLFGLTGASFVAHRRGLPERTATGMYFNPATHREKRVTGPYHALSSLFRVAPIHDRLRARVVNSKNAFMAAHAQFLPRTTNQPLLCTHVEAKVVPNDEHIVLYTPRSDLRGSVVCHLGEIHHDELRILDRLKLEPLANA